MSESNQPQQSPDGNWWWDGQHWRPVQPPGRKSQLRPWPVIAAILGGLVLLLVILVAAGANDAGTSSTTLVTTAPPTTATASARDGSCSPQPCANDNYGWIVSVSNIRYDAAGGDFEKPEAGNVFVMVNITFTNKLDREQHANPAEFVLMDGAGIKHTWQPMTESCPAWAPVNLTKGATLGPKCLSFEATAGKPSPLVLVWTPSGFGGSYPIKLDSASPR